MLLNARIGCFLRVEEVHSWGLGSQEEEPLLIDDIDPPKLPSEPEKDPQVTEFDQQNSPKIHRFLGTYWNTWVGP